MRVHSVMAIVALLFAGSSWAQTPCRAPQITVEPVAGSPNTNEDIKVGVLTGANSSWLKVVDNDGVPNLVLLSKSLANFPDEVIAAKTSVFKNSLRKIVQSYSEAGSLNRGGFADSGVSGTAKEVSKKAQALLNQINGQPDKSITRENLKAVMSDLYPAASKLTYASYQGSGGKFTPAPERKRLDEILPPMSLTGSGIPNDKCQARFTLQPVGTSASDFGAGGSSSDGQR